MQTHYELNTHENPVNWFMANSREFQRILTVFSWEILQDFSWLVTLEKAWKKKNIKKAIKNSLTFQFSWAMKTLKFWANPWNTHENTMTIFGCFSLPFNGIENAMNYKEGFSWCCSSWSFHGATEFMAHEKPMVIPLILKD